MSEQAKEMSDTEKVIRKQGTIKLQGKEYLQVASRILLARTENPDWSIETAFDTLQFGEEKHLVARCLVSDGCGKILATATKTVRREGRGPAAKYPFEMAETGEIGRALGMCGYGTLTGDLDEGDQIADAPQAARKW